MLLKCRKCQNEKSNTEFYKHKRNYDQECKPCRRETERHRFAEKRRNLIIKLGGKCVCCGENSFEFLTFDHPNGRNGTRGETFIQWIREGADLPKDLQLLCANCNGSLGHYGYCPHHPELKRPIARREYADSL